MRAVPPQTIPAVRCAGSAFRYSLIRARRAIVIIFRARLGPNKSRGGGRSLARLSRRRGRGMGNAGGEAVGCSWLDLASRRQGTAQCTPRAPRAAGRVSETLERRGCCLPESKKPPQCFHCKGSISVVPGAGLESAQPCGPGISRHIL